MRNQLRAFWAAALIALPFSASADLSAVPSGKYTLDRSHGYITFTYSHLGFSNPRVGFNSFDTVLCSLSVEYLVRPFEVFAELARVLRPGGRLVINTPHLKTTALRRLRHRRGALREHPELSGSHRNRR